MILQNENAINKYIYIDGPKGCGKSYLLNSSYLKNDSKLYVKNIVYTEVL